MVIKYNNDLYSVFSVNHRTPGNLRGFVQARMRSLKSGTMIENRFSSEDKVEKAILDEIEMEYLYDDGDYFYFMNSENYEQMHLTKELLGDATNYLIPQLKVKVEFYEGKPMGVELPASVEMTVVETEPGMRGATVSNVTLRITQARRSSRSRRITDACSNGGKTCGPNACTPLCGSENQIRLWLSTTRSFG